MNSDLAIILLVTITILVMMYVMRNEEHKTLVEAERERASGKFIKLSDGFVHYDLAGPAEGRTIVLVHGFSTWSFTWVAAFRALAAAGFRVIRYDLYGRGYSDRPSVEYTKDLFDQQLAELLAALDIRSRVDLVGSSMGGIIATTFAARYPEKIRTLTLIDPAFFYLERVPFPLGVPLVGTYVGHVFAVPFIARAQTKDFRYPERHHAYSLKYRIQMQYRGFARAILSTIRNLPRWNAAEDLERAVRTNIPILLLWGMEDRTVPLSVCDKVREIAPSAEFHLIDDAAHMPHYERPEIVNPIIVRFLSE